VATHALYVQWVCVFCAMFILVKLCCLLACLLQRIKFTQKYKRPESVNGYKHFNTRMCKIVFHSPLNVTSHNEFCLSHSPIPMLWLIGHRSLVERRSWAADLAQPNILARRLPSVLRDHSEMCIRGLTRPSQAMSRD